MTEKELQFERIYEKTKDFGRTQFVREIQIQINDNKKKDKKIEKLQKKAELADHYKHLCSEVKKQKDEIFKYIKSFEYYIPEDNKNELLRMLGEIE